uniref:Uncharacterized protein n=2 Tax=Parascaris univalens TaxID=6257 RepID=A0A915BNJ9_PARUN
MYYYATANVSRRGVVEHSIRLHLPRKIRSNDSLLQISPVQSGSHRVNLPGVHLRSVSSTQESSITGVETVDNDRSRYMANRNPIYAITRRAPQQLREPMSFSIDSNSSEEFGSSIFGFMRANPFERFSNAKRKASNRKRRSVSRKEAIENSLSFVDMKGKGSQSNNHAHSSKQRSKRPNSQPVLRRGYFGSSNTSKCSQSISHPKTDAKRYSEFSWLPNASVDRSNFPKLNYGVNKKAGEAMKNENFEGNMNEKNKKRTNIKHNKITENCYEKANASTASIRSEKKPPTMSANEESLKSEEYTSLASDTTNSQS